jgi:hypothetical protein
MSEHHHQHHAQGGLDRQVFSGPGDSYGGTTITENDYERYYRGTANGSAGRTSSTSAPVVDNTPFHRAQIDIFKNMQKNRLDSYGAVAGFVGEVEDFWEEIKKRAKLNEIGHSVTSHFNSIFRQAGLGPEMDIIGAFWEGLTSSGAPDTFEKTDPNAGLARRAAGLFCDVVGLRWNTPKVELTSGEIFNAAFTKETGGSIPYLTSGLPEKFDQLGPEARQNFEKSMNFYAEQLLHSIEHKYKGLEPNQHKALLQQVGRHFGDFVNDTGVTVVTEETNGRKPGIYLNVPKDSPYANLNLADPHDLGMIINHMAGPEIFVSKLLPKAHDLSIDVNGLGASPNGPANAPDVGTGAPPGVGGPPGTTGKGGPGDGTPGDGTNGPGDGANGLGGTGGPGSGASGPGPSTDGAPGMRHDILLEQEDPSLGKSTGPRRVEHEDLSRLFQEAGISEKQFLQFIGMTPRQREGEEVTLTSANPWNPTDAIVGKEFLQNLPPDIGAEMLSRLGSPDREKNLGTWFERMAAADNLPASLTYLGVETTLPREPDGSYGIQARSYLKDHPQEVDAISGRVADIILARIPAEEREGVLGISGPLKMSHIEPNGAIVFEDIPNPNPGQLKDWLMQRPDVMNKGARAIAVEERIVEQKHETINRLLDEVGMTPRELKDLLVGTLGQTRADAITISEEGGQVRLEGIRAKEIGALEEALVLAPRRQAEGQSGASITDDKGTGSVRDSTTGAVQEQTAPPDAAHPVPPQPRPLPGDTKSEEAPAPQPGGRTGSGTGSFPPPPDELRAALEEARAALGTSGHTAPPPPEEPPQVDGSSRSSGSTPPGSTRRGGRGG